MAAAGCTGAGCGGGGASDSASAVGKVGASGTSAVGVVGARFCEKRAFVMGTPISSGTSATTTST
jgi:hypothetical protein